MTQALLTQPKPSLNELIETLNQSIAAVWPLSHSALVNPLTDIELPFWEAILRRETAFYNAKNQRVNCHLIKWLQAFLDEGEAIWAMPGKEKGFYTAWRSLAPYDKTLCRTKKIKCQLLAFSEQPLEAIEQALAQLKPKETLQFLKQELLELAGFAGYIKWRSGQTEYVDSPIDLKDYLAARLVVTCLISEEKIEESFQEPPHFFTQTAIEQKEKEYASSLIQQILKQKFTNEKKKPLGQLIFCIDARMEPIRRALEGEGEWQTWSCSGFFGLPIQHHEGNKRKACCPTLLKPIHDVLGTPNALSHNIPLEQQVQYAASCLQKMGLTEAFAPLVVIFGHGSTFKNNPHGSCNHCGACGAHRGGVNAALLASLLNNKKVRMHLHHLGILIPFDTEFIGAEYDTTTHTAKFYEGNITTPNQEILLKLKNAIEKTKPLEVYEKGLINNAAFIIGPRALSENLDLKSRVFLHSYDWTQDSDYKVLDSLMTAPLLVVHGINMHYFFSAYQPVAFGSGHKATQNVVGKMGVMQGCGSDLMHGLPFEALFDQDNKPRHEPLRLLTLIYAPKEQILKILASHPHLQNLVSNKWLHLVALDPQDQSAYSFSSNDWIPNNPVSGGNH